LETEALPQRGQEGIAVVIAARLPMPSEQSDRDFNDHLTQEQILQSTVPPVRYRVASTRRSLQASSEKSPGLF
jgi:hypothetical protein